MTSSADETAAAPSVPDGLFRVHGEIITSDAWLEIEGWSAADLGDRPLPPAPATAAADWDEWQELVDAPAPFEL
jgi:hypothetical protein